MVRLDRVSRDALARAQGQARLQVASEDDGVIRYEILEPERDASGTPIPNRGLLALPEPVTGDLFFDIEGARYYSEDSRVKCAMRSARYTAFTSRQTRFSAPRRS